MERTCQYNAAIDCDGPECYHCGLDPEVAQARLVAITSEKLYKVPFTGYCEVWAKSPKEALDKAEDIEQQFFAHYDYYDPICMKMEGEDELDEQSP